jgi:hypothetical protein
LCAPLSACGSAGGIRFPALFGGQPAQPVQRTAPEHRLASPSVAKPAKPAEQEEEPGIEEVLALARPYLPFPGAEGEMVTNLGRSAYLALHGADGIVDISPFTCMNGVVSEAIYPKVSRDYKSIPIRNFYFDGQQSDLDGDLAVYLELVRSYRERKLYKRHYPPRFLPHQERTPMTPPDGLRTPLAQSEG